LGEGPRGSAENLDFRPRWGAAVAINYRTTEIAPALLEATAGQGVDLVCDLVGGQTALATFPAIKAGGRHVMAGFSGGIEVEDEGFPLRPIVFGNFDLCGAMMSYRADDAPAVPGVHPWPRSVAEDLQDHLVE